MQNSDFVALEGFAYSSTYHLPLQWNLGLKDAVCDQYVMQRGNTRLGDAELHFRFRWPGFRHVFLLHVILSRKAMAMAMQAQASVLPARDGIPRSSLWGCRLAPSTSSELCPWINVSRKSIPVRMAINRKKKEETVDKIKQELEGCSLMASIRYTGLTVKQMQELRKVLPDTTKLIVAKNRLVNKAVQGTEWEAIAPALKGMNAWLFVHTEEIPAALKPYRTFQKEAKVDSNDFTGGVFEGKFYPPEEFKSLETMPTRAEIFSKLLGSLKAPSSSVVTVLQGPSRNLVMTLKAYVQKLEEQQSEPAS